MASMSSALSTGQKKMLFEVAMKTVIICGQRRRPVPDGAQVLAEAWNEIDSRAEILQ